MIAKTLTTLSLCALVSTMALAAGDQHIVLRPDGRTMTGTGHTQGYPEQNLPDKGLVTIYNTIAKKDPKGLYWSNLGSAILGPYVKLGVPEAWQAVAFTPGANHTLTEIQLAASYVEGPNAVVVSLNNDANGLPGTVIESWNLSNLPPFLSCCELTVVTEPKGILLTAGTQYWVVVSTDSNEMRTWGGMNINVVDEIDPAVTAFYCSADVSGTCQNNDQWTLATGTLPAFAFAALGTN